MIVEDDVEFANGFFEKLNRVWISDFDMLFLNGTHGVIRKPKPFDDNWLKVDELYGTFAYIIKSGFYDTALWWLKKERYPADKIYSMFMQFHRAYKLKKPIVFHKKGLSEITGIVPKYYKHLEK